MRESFLEQDFSPAVGSKCLRNHCYSSTNTKKFISVEEICVSRFFWNQNEANKFFLQIDDTKPKKEPSSQKIEKSNPPVVFHFSENNNN